MDARRSEDGDSAAGEERADPARQKEENEIDMGNEEAALSHRAVAILSPTL